jgi:ribosomal protein L32
VAAVQAADLGEHVVALVVGEPGIGKTRLLRELAARVSPGRRRGRRTHDEAQSPAAAVVTTAGHNGSLTPLCGLPTFRQGLVAVAGPDDDLEDGHAKDDGDAGSRNGTAGSGMAHGGRR